LFALALAAFGCGDFVFFAEEGFFLVGFRLGLGVGVRVGVGVQGAGVVAGLFDVSRFAVALVGGVAGSAC
jgi:hypothetical protein